MPTPSYIKYYDQNTKRPYWYCIATNQTQWTAPLEFSDVLPRQVDTEDNGRPDAIGYDTTGDGVSDMFFKDTRHDGQFNVEIHDTTGDGRPNIAIPNINNPEFMQRSLHKANVASRQQHPRNSGGAPAPIPRFGGAGASVRDSLVAVSPPQEELYQNDRVVIHDLTHRQFTYMNGKQGVVLSVAGDRLVVSLDLGRSTKEVRILPKNLRKVTDADVVNDSDNSSRIGQLRENTTRLAETNRRAQALRAAGEREEREAQARLLSRESAGSRRVAFGDGSPQFTPPAKKKKAKKTKKDKSRPHPHRTERTSPRRPAATASAAASQRAMSPIWNWKDELGGSAQPRGIFPVQVSADITANLDADADRLFAKTHAAVEAQIRWYAQSTGAGESTSARRAVAQVWEGDMIDLTNEFDAASVRTILNTDPPPPPPIERLAVVGPAEWPASSFVATGPQSSLPVGPAAATAAVGVLDAAVGPAGLSSTRVGVLSLRDQQYVFAASRNSPSSQDDRLLSFSEGARFVLIQIYEPFWLMQPEMGGEAKWVVPEGLMRSVDSRYTGQHAHRANPTGPKGTPHDRTGTAAAVQRLTTIAESDRARSHLTQQKVVARGSDAVKRASPARRSLAKGPVLGVKVTQLAVGPASYA